MGSLLYENEVSQNSKKMDWRNKVAVVTGANSGIGYQISMHLLGMNMTVIGLDRNVENIKDKNENLYALEVDLTREIEVTRAFQWIEENHCGVDVLINNAGLGGRTSLLEGNVSEWRKLLDINVIALTQCTSEAIRSMRKRGITHGQIINISSNLANIVPAYAPFHFYSATKHAVKAITEGFRLEIKDLETPIRISNIAPGLVRTEIFKSSLGNQMNQVIYDKYPSIEPTDVASSVEYILCTPHNVNRLHQNAIKSRWRWRVCKDCAGMRSVANTAWSSAKAARIVLGSVGISEVYEINIKPVGSEN